MFSKLKRFFIKIIYSFSDGLKNAENEMFVSKNTSNADSSYTQQINVRNVGGDLLKGEVTQEVEDLRYSTYQVYKESNNYEYIGEGISVKKEKEDFNINNFSFTQRNKLFCRGICDADNEIDKFTLTIAYALTPRFKIERFAESFNISGNQNTVNITFRFNKSYDINSPITKMFYNELMKIETNPRNNEIFNNNIVSLCFTTYKAQGEDDFVMYILNNLTAKKYEFFDQYVNITFTSNDFTRQDLTEKFFSSNQHKRYENKMGKQSNPKMIVSDIKQYKCSKCGELMNQFDYEITSYDIGKPMCVKCLEKYLTFKE